MKRFLGVLVLVVALVGLLSGCGESAAEQAAREAAEREVEYRELFMNTIAIIGDNYFLAQGTNSNVASSWRTAIDNRWDFNEFIGNLRATEVFQDTFITLEENHSEIVSAMQGLQNPPERFENAYAALLELFEIYSQAHDLAQSPTGSLQSFNSTINDLSSRFSSTTSRINVLIPAVD